jgi:hypothetical protein
MTLITFQDGKPVLRDGKVGTEQACCCGSGNCVQLYIYSNVLDLEDECHQQYIDAVIQAFEDAGWNVELYDSQAETINVWLATCESCCIDCEKLQQALVRQPGDPTENWYHLSQQPSDAWVNVAVIFVPPGESGDCPNAIDCQGIYTGGVFFADYRRVGATGTNTVGGSFGDWPPFAQGCPGLSLPSLGGVPFSINGDEGGDCGGIWIPRCQSGSLWCKDTTCDTPCGNYDFRANCDLVVTSDWNEVPDYEWIRGPVDDYITGDCQIEFSIEELELTVSLAMGKDWWCRPKIPVHNYPLGITLECNPLP